MQIRNLGGSGLRMSAVGLGCNNFGQRTDLEASRKVIYKALDLGITLFDTADIYANMGGSETVLGTVLGERRKYIVLATKFSKPMATDGTKQGASRPHPPLTRMASFLFNTPYFFTVCRTSKPSNCGWPR
jgi:aryl-alcohol dehydrogenase-like predicted oxidoreductase